jgi:hypothetical protein
MCLSLECADLTTTPAGLPGRGPRCQRFGLLRPVAAVCVPALENAQLSVAQNDGDRSPKANSATRVGAVARLLRRALLPPNVRRGSSRTQARRQTTPRNTRAQVAMPSPSGLCGGIEMLPKSARSGTATWRTVEPSLTVGLLPRATSQAV